MFDLHDISNWIRGKRFSLHHRCGGTALQEVMPKQCLTFSRHRVTCTDCDVVMHVEISPEGRAVTYELPDPGRSTEMILVCKSRPKVKTDAVPPEKACVVAGCRKSFDGILPGKLCRTHKTRWHACGRPDFELWRDAGGVTATAWALVQRGMKIGSLIGGGG